jgi:putative ABC transport system permease protein
VSSAGFISFAPMTGGGGIWPVAVPGQTGTTQTGAIRLVSPGYFDTLGTPLILGRDISDSDVLDSPQVAVVSESFVRRYWPNQDPIGRTFHFAFEGFPFAQLDRTVVGVVRDIRFRGLERRSEPQIYLAYRQLPDGPSYYAPKDLVVRSSIDPAQLVPAVRAVVQQADPEMPISAVRTLRDIVDLQTAPRSMQLRLVAAFAALSLLLAGLGIHGLLSFAVGQRKAEFGLRIALGAQRRDIISVVLREALLLTGIGIVTGLIVSHYVGRWMESLLAGVSSSDPASLAVTIIVALAMTLSGSLLPAIRATRADPTAVIRGE